MRREAWIVLLGIGLLAPIQLGAQKSQRRAENSYRSGNRGAVACTSTMRSARRDCSGRLAPIRVASGRIHGVRARRTWIPVDWGNVFIRHSADRDRFDAISQGRLQRMLGRASVERLRSLGRHDGLRGRLRGHWYMGSRRGAVLVISIGGREVAQFVDYNRDGWVDQVLLSNRTSARTVYTYR